MPNLERLSVEELRALRNKLRCLIDAGDFLHDEKFAPVFDLTPGQSPMIHLTGWTMPHAYAADEAEADAPPERDDAPYAWSPATGIVPIGEGHWTKDAEPVAESIERIDANTGVLWQRDEDLRKRVTDLELAVAYQTPDLIKDPGNLRLTEDLSIPATAPDEGGAEAGNGPGPVEPAAPADPMPAGAADAPTEQPAAPPPAAGEPGPAPEQTAGPTAAATGPDGGGGAVAAAPPAATHCNPNPPITPPPWTEAEEEALIAHAVRLILGGMGKKAAHMEAGRLIGRPGEGASFRLYTKLKDRFDAALQAASKAAFDRAEPVAVPDDPPSPAAPDPSPTDGVDPRYNKFSAAYADGSLKQRFARGVTAMAPALQAATRAAFDKGEPVAVPDDPSPLTPYGELCAHLDALPRKDGWTEARDLDLMNLAGLGWGMNEIAQDMDLRADKVKARFDLLTGLYKDETDRWQRRFTREDVLAELKRRAGQEG